MSDEKRDPPIEEPGFIGGVKVVDIGDVRVSRGLSRRSSSSCPHRRLIYDMNERRIWCKECEKDVEPFDGFRVIVEQINAATSAIDRREERVKAAEDHALISLASKALDEAWRRKRMVPACPHCSQGLFPEDFKHGIGASLGVDYARALAERRRREKQNRR